MEPMNISSGAPSDQQDFDDAIHQLVNSSRRPAGEAEVTALESLLTRLIEHCGHDSDRWKILLLTVTHKRYHRLSPQARDEAAMAPTGEDLIAAGEGERCMFYIAVRVLFTLSQQSAESKLALETLIKIAPLAGGSRDICAILESMVTILARTGLEQTRAEMLALHGSESLASLVGYGVYKIQDQLQQDNSLVSTKNLLQMAADTLDNDFEIIQRNKGNTTATEKEFPSTLHMFLPHRDRGRTNKRKSPGRPQTKVPDRLLANSIAEIIIWARTAKAMSNKAFKGTYQQFLKACEDKNSTSIKSKLHILQTIIRSLRKELNSYARAQGFMLSDQYNLDANALRMSQVNKGKAGDLTNLGRLAKKHKSEKVLKLINLRFASNPNKITKYSSVSELIQHVPTPNTDISNTELAQVERDIHIARVKATIRYLCGFIKENAKGAMIASMENSKTNHVAAILLAAALSNWEQSTESIESQEKAARLFIAGTEEKIACFQDVMDLIDKIAGGMNKNEIDAPSYMDQDGTVTTKAVMNMIDRHLNDSEVMFLITSADLRLPNDVMGALTARGCSLHCHDADNKVGERLGREKANKGDITISLAWDTVDDLDLHVITPDGEDIHFRRKKSKDGLCMLDVDMNGGGPQSSEPVENVFAGNLDLAIQAPQGSYTVIVQNYAYHSPGSSRNTAVPFQVVVDMNGVKEKFAGQCLGSGEQSNVTVHKFTYEGRTIPFPREEHDKTAFGTSNMVNITASTGQTLETLSQLVQVTRQHEHLDTVRMLVEDETDSGIQADTEEGSADGARDGEEVGDMEGTSLDVGESEGVMEGTKETDVEPRPLLAKYGKLEVTSRDRINILLAKLPQRFHFLVGEAFGGSSLAEKCAAEISHRMVADKIPISELQRKGYPANIVEAVKTQMAVAAPY